MPHLRIETEAGRELWSDMNNHYGSAVWGRVGDGIVAVETEMRDKYATSTVASNMTQEGIETFTSISENPDMTEYTPTTEEVRDCYLNQLTPTGPTSYEFIDEAQASAEFERWFTQIKKQAAADERQRLLDIHLAQSKKMGYSRDYIIEALKGKVWKDDENDLAK